VLCCGVCVCVCVCCVVLCCNILCVCVYIYNIYVCVCADFTSPLQVHNRSGSNSVLRAPTLPFANIQTRSPSKSMYGRPPPSTVRSHMYVLYAYVNCLSVCVCVCVCVGYFVYIIYLSLSLSCRSLSCPLSFTLVFFSHAHSLTLSLSHTHTHTHTHIHTHTHTYTHNNKTLKKPKRMMLPVGDARATLKKTRREAKTTKKILLKSSAHLLPSHLRSASNPHTISSQPILPPTGRVLTRSTSS